MTNKTDKENIESSIRPEDIIYCIDNCSDGIMISDGEGTILYVNKQYLTLTKLQNDIIGINISEFEHRGVMEKSACLASIKYKRPYTRVHHEVNDVEIIAISKPLFSPDGEIQFVVTNIRDISTYVNLDEKIQNVNAVIDSGKRMPIINREEIVAYSPEMISILALAQRISQVDVNILLLGETGVGKDVLVRFIHENSPRKKNRLISLNCGAIPSELMESELFGYAPGSFTGGLKDGKKGILHHAQGGTLFLDEIGEMPIHLQIKLLRVIEERVFSPIGSTEEIPLDVRIISATNKNIKEEIAKGTFREDLYYRLGVVTIEVPPLRRRQEDIIPLASHFIKVFADKYKNFKKIDADTLLHLQQYSWPGNVRELRNVIEQMVVLSQEEYYVLPQALQQSQTPQMGSLKEYMDRVEKEYLEKMLGQYPSARKMAQALEIHHTTLLRKLNKHGIKFDE